MRNDIRRYNYDDNSKLITKEEQMKSYLDEKFGSIGSMDIDLSGIDDLKNKLNDSTSSIINAVEESTTTIVDAVEDAKPCLCNLATKEDLCRMKCSVVNEINKAKEEIVEEFGNLNDMVPCCSNKGITSIEGLKYDNDSNILTLSYTQQKKLMECKTKLDVVNDITSVELDPNDHIAVSYKKGNTEKTVSADLSKLEDDIDWEQMK